MSKRMEPKEITTLCDQLQKLQMLSDTDTCIEIENCLTDVQCYDNINEANRLGFSNIPNFKPQHRTGTRYIFKTKEFQDNLLKATKDFLPKELTNNGLAYKLSHINQQIKILKYEKGSHFNLKHCDDTFVEIIGGVCHKSLLTVIVYLNEGYKGGETTMCRSIFRNYPDEVGHCRPFLFLSN